ncbi:MAG: TolC family protein [Phycisphaerales bacterium]
MKQQTLTLAVILGATILGSSCATPQPGSSFDRVAAETSDRTGVAIAWPMNAKARAAIEAQVNALLSEPLDQESAVVVALLNNRALRAKFAQLGFAEADLVEAGLLENPSLTAAIGFPDRPPSMAQLDFGLTLNLLRVLLMPANKDIASVRLDAEVLRVADVVVETAAMAQIAFLDLQASTHMTALLREIAIAAEVAFEFAEQVHAAGNLSDLALANQMALREMARLDYAHALAESAALRERLNVHLGVWGEHTGWTLVDRLPEIPASEADLSQLESLAIRQRLDLVASAKEVEAISKALGMQQDWRYILTTDVGFNAEHDTDGQWVFGPELSIELPIFNQRQAEILRLDAALLEAEARLEAMAIEVRSDVRRLRDRLYAIRYECEHYRDTIVPLRERITMLTQQQYNFMLVDTFDLLAAKREETDAYRGYIESIHNYWTTRVELERVVGGRLPDAGEHLVPGGTNQPATTIPMAPDHSHGGN